jgi:hypothetical protein
MERETQQREGHPSTWSLPHHRVTPKSDTVPDKKQDPDPDQKLKRFLQHFNLIKPEIIWTLLVVVAIGNLFYPLDIYHVIVFLVLIAVAAGYITLPRAIDLLQGRFMSMKLSPPPEEQKAGGQPGEKAINEQDEPA